MIVEAALVLAMQAAPPPPSFPKTRQEHYDTAQRFAHCAAHFDHGAQISRLRGFPESAATFDGHERGWRLVGIFFLQGSLEGERQFQTSLIFAEMEANKVQQFKAWREMDPNGYASKMMAEFDLNCAPWASVQKSFIAAMRMAPATPDGGKP